MLTPEEMNEFNVEALELLEKAETSLLALDEGAEFSGHYDNIFRAFHNLKGAAGMMELNELQSHVHQLETILMQYKGAGEIPKDKIEFFLKGIDATKSILRGEKISFQYETSSQDSATTEPVVKAEEKVAAEASLPTSSAVASSESIEPVKPVAPSSAAEAARDASLSEFFSECDEILSRIAQTLEEVVSSGARAELIDSLYRDVHSLKGGAFLMGYTQMGELSHALENCLDKLRESKAAPKAELLDLIFMGTDILERVVDSVRKQTGQSYQVEIDGLIPLLSGTEPFAAETQVAAETQEPAVEASVEVSPPASNTNSKVIEAEVIPINTAKVEVKMEKVQETKGAPVSESDVKVVSQEATAEGGQDAASTVRVPVPLLDKLMTLVGEMVLVRNQVIQYSNKSDDLEFLNLSQRLNVVTGEIQGEMMKTRMQPIGNVLSKFQRVVRDLSRDLKKKIDLHVEGSETELDKTLLEAVKDPLTHIIRNSCDHGVETPEERKAKGKPEGGSIKVRSYHEGGQVIVEIADDGKGLHRDKLIAKALEKKIITQEKATSMSDREAMNLIFAAGFSTAAQITNVSGRGVGMDVVRSNIDKIGGTVELDSIPDKGTTIRLKIPLTLAIVPAMIVRSGEDRYAIPQIKLVELVRIEKGKGENQIEYLQGKPVFRLRGNLLPLLDIKQVLKFKGHDTKKVTDSAEAVNIIVLNSEKQLFGLIVDEIQDTADIVVKPLSRFLKSLAVYSGATVLGDGSVALILDVAGVANLSLQASKGKESANTLALEQGEKNAADEEMQEFLLFRLNSPTKHAVFLGYVQRLEEFKRSSIEYSGEQRVVRYRNAVLPIISLNKALNYKESAGTETDVVPVIVTKRGDKHYGIEVNEILDVMSTGASLDGSICDRPGLFGNIVTQNEVVVLVDPHQCIPATANSQRKTAISQPRLAMPVSEVKPKMSQDQMLEELAEITQANLSEANRKILFVEDTAFFRKHVAGVLERAGYEVSSVKDGEEALVELEKRGVGHYSVVLSDIEMPKLNGYDLASAIRRDARWNSLPLVALTTKAEAKDRERGKKAGFSIYLEKLNSDELLATLDQITNMQKAA